MIGSRKQNILLKHFKSAQAIYEADDISLREVPGFTENNIRVLNKNRDESVIDRGVEVMQRMGIKFIPVGHRDYPYLLSKIPDAPVGLFFQGDIAKMEKHPKVAIIGSRKCSEYGLSTALTFGMELAKEGVVIVSGMARGIDSMAHRGALKGRDGEEIGKTIAVLGCGVDTCYPPENRELRDEIISTGCILSEYPPGVPPHGRHFPARNRIISGLSQIIIVVESGIKSGTLITVDQAQEQGRDVMAVPGNITNKYSQGTNNLIKQGAEPVCCYEDVLHMLGREVEIQISLAEIEPKNTKTRIMKNNKTNTNNPKSVETVAPEEKIVYDVLTFESQSLDEIVIKTNSSVHVTQYILTMLELKGLVTKLPGMRYTKR